MEDKNLDSNPDNRDPITKEPGSHPVGTGIGSAGGARHGRRRWSGRGRTDRGRHRGSDRGRRRGRRRARGRRSRQSDRGAGILEQELPDAAVLQVGQGVLGVRARVSFRVESAGRAEYAGKKFDEVEPELLRDWNGSAGATDPWTDARDATHDAWLRVRGN